ncbi:MAG: alanyl-tRNA editing protein [Boseongicola sp.]
MTKPLYRDDAYLRSAMGQVIDVNDLGGVVLDQSIFYPTGGGQPGDSGTLTWDGGQLTVTTTVKGEGDGIVLVPADGSPLPKIGSEVSQDLDWQQRSGHMRIHTALHLLSVVIPLPVTGGSISQAKGRLDFDMMDPIEDKDALSANLNELIARDLPVVENWITEGELDANPGLVKTMTVKPPRGAGKIRLIKIGEGENKIDLQPCGGTHVSRTSEIGRVRLGKVEKKGARNRRVYIHLEP